MEGGLNTENAKTFKDREAVAVAMFPAPKSLKTEKSFLDFLVRK